MIDDLVAFVDASTWRRRGLTFDGATDVVLTDTALVDGRSPRIAAFRRGLRRDDSA